MEWGFAAGELAAAPDLARALEPAARRFRHWEVTAEGPWATPEGLAAVGAALGSFRLGLTVHASFRRVDLAGPDPAARARDVALVASQVAAARGLGAGAVVVHPGNRLRGLADPGAVRRCRESLVALAAAGREHGVEVRVENMPRGPVELAQDPGELRALVEGTTGAACWDLGHARTLGQVAPGPAAGVVREVHLHDNAGHHDEHRPMSLDCTWLPGALAGLDPAVLVTVEHRRVAECLASREAAQALLNPGGRRGLAGAEGTGEKGEAWRLR